MNSNNPKCPKCNSRDTYRRYMVGAGDNNECFQCGNLWGWYYDRNKPENKFKPTPN